MKIEEKLVVLDFRKKLNTVIEGRFDEETDCVANPAKVSKFFVVQNMKVETIPEFMRCCGYDFSSLVGRRVRITVESIDF